MYIIPAIDLRGGKCVRLIQGDYHRQINYQENPVKQAEDFINQGAEWVHIVDLDGAKVGRPVNTPTISAIAKLGKLKIEVGGGLRHEQDLKSLLDLGIARVIIGTQAVTDFEWFSDMTRKFPEKIALGLDARGSHVVTAGWGTENPKSLIELASEAARLPIAAIIYTDVTKDGMLAGPNIERTKTLIHSVPVPVIASGGVTTVEDIKKLVSINAAGIIVGRALYEGTINLTEAIKAAKSSE
ncbi:MAG: 1-(5-phosphoribosyl)-5-[(5-phosphoribosylamino)methylideneamino]imidazole-4-carboxamide isomerase [Sedimentisphaerales bacterium]|nr:1-(5-phosphoribosyl)-5-[(5-phosphoribosylamino)methylideneamino]imidazole-4-carboxamide isomerase [Sedimentisphaerales bacterium]